jgi:hypothetical protein
LHPIASISVPGGSTPSAINRLWPDGGKLEGNAMTVFWNKPILPVEPKMRAWVDDSMQRFVDMFGAESVTTATVATPTNECFPDDWNGTPACVDALFARVCGYMGVNRSQVDVAVFADEDRERVEERRKAHPLMRLDNPGAAGLYHHDPSEEKPIVGIDRNGLCDINKVIATMAHELAHVRLLGGSRIDGESPDMEPLTDLFVVYRGMGIFNANCATNFQQYSDGVYQGWSVKTLGYLSERTYGYALAVFAQLRGERNPRWARYLKLNVRTYMKQSAAVIAWESRR